MVSWFRPQNQADYGLLDAPQNRQEDDDGVGHAWRYSGLLHVEENRARVSQSSLKTGGGTAWMVHVASSWRLHGGQVEDGRVNAMGCVKPYYPCFVVFYVLGPRGILVF
jgi:hypothetical protein